MKCLLCKKEKGMELFRGRHYEIAIRQLEKIIDPSLLRIIFNGCTGLEENYREEHLCNSCMKSIEIETHKYYAAKYKVLIADIKIRSVKDD